MPVRLRGKRVTDDSELTEARLAVSEALASVRAEGLEPTSRGLELLEGVATGAVSEDAAIEELVRHHQVKR